MLDDEIRERLTKPNVVGTGLGQKYVDGLPTDEKAVLVFVETKMPQDDLSAQAMLPTKIDGMPIDVIEVGKLVKHSFTDRVRPVRPGYSVGHAKVTAGTIGGIFRDKDGDIVLLSNSHVFANEGNASPGDAIYQPGSADVDGKIYPVKANDWDSGAKAWPYIGTLKSFLPYNKSSNPHDSAICKIHEKLLEDLLDTSYPTLNADVAGFAEPAVGMTVQKCGRTTGYTTGRIIAMHGEFTIGYDVGPLKFTDCVVTTAMSKGGDSGSLILNHDMNAVALLFAGSDKVTLANPIGPVASYYGLQPYTRTTGVTVQDRKWTTVDGPEDTVTVTPTSISIDAYCNNYAFAQSGGTGFQEFYVEAFTGDDEGASWGPGIAVAWPNGTLKINLRHGGQFAASYLGTEYINMGRVQPNTWYGLKITVGNTITGEVNDGGTWYKVIELPRSIVTTDPIAFRIGKMDLNGNASSYQESGSKHSCAFRNYRIS